jgi:hypothetical protein
MKSSGIERWAPLEQPGPNRLIFDTALYKGYYQILIVLVLKQVCLSCYTNIMLDIVLCLKHIDIYDVSGLGVTPILR